MVTVVNIHPDIPGGQNIHIWREIQLDKIWLFIKSFTLQSCGVSEASVWRPNVPTDQRVGIKRWLLYLTSPVSKREGVHDEMS